ncbi:MAG: putative membrane protein YfcA [Candidatus Azotimanducaceae bacterium]|jgi:uncharacterized membrane protein YfcA
MIYLPLALALSIATLITCFISGVLSMAGGMILMGVFGFFLSIPVAMVLHGVTQSFSNGSRVWIYRKHLKWQVLIYYSAGAFLVLGVFTGITLVPSKGLMFILIGLFPFIALIIPKKINLDMEHGPVAVMSGIVVTTAQMLAGASGPVLDMFYVQSKMSREAILGTKAVTQTLGHLLKLFYYGVLLSAFTAELPIWIFPVVVCAAIAGSYLGSFVVAKMSDNQFKTIGRYVIMLIGIIYVGNGVFMLRGNL